MRYLALVTLLLSGPGLFAAGAEAPAPTRHLVDQSYLCMRTLAELRSVRTALQAYVLDHGALPHVSAVEDVRELIEPAYIRSATLTDAWGTPFAIDVAASGKEFSLSSAGSDRAFDRASWSTPGLLSGSDEDAVLFSSPDRDREWVIQR